jgi:hypothetical protein
MALLPQPLRDPDTREAFNRATSWLRLLARVGYVSKGVVYIVMGLLAARAAFRLSRDTTSFRGALLRIVDKPFGHTMLAILAVGFAGYAVWQIISAAIDAEDVGEGRAAIGHRVEQVFTGLVYGGLAKAAATLLLVNGSTSRQLEYRWSVWLSEVPFGHVALVIAGLGLFGYGLYQFWRARSEHTVLRRVNLPEFGRIGRFAVVTMGRYGLAMRGVVFAMFGWLVFQGGVSRGHSIASNLGDAMRAIGDAPGGPWILSVVAAGLVAHGCYQFVNARYRRLRERRIWRWTRRLGTREGDRRALPASVTPGD